MHIVLIIYQQFENLFHFLAVAPVITAPPTNLTVISPDSATFNCVATAKPRAIIQWTRNGNVLNVTMGKFTTTDSTQGDCIITNPPSDCITTSRLDIADTIPNDSGEYVCTAINAASYDIESASLTVNGKYSFQRPVYVL